MSGAGQRREKEEKKRRREEQQEEEEGAYSHNADPWSVSEGAAHGEKR